MPRIVRHKHWAEDHPYFPLAEWHYVTKKVCDGMYRDWQAARMVDIKLMVDRRVARDEERREIAYREHIKRYQLEVPLGHPHPEVNNG